MINGRHEDGGKTDASPCRRHRAPRGTTATGVMGGFDEIGEVVKPVQVQVVKEGLFRHFGVVDDPELIKP